MGRKYRLLWPKEVMLPTGEKKWLHRIKATRDIPLFDVRKGDLGGYVSSKHVLSQSGSCWITENAIAEERLTGDFMGPLRKNRTERESLITGSSILTGNAYIVASTITDAEIRDNAIVRSSVIGSGVQIYDAAQVIRSNVEGDIEICNEAVVDDARITGKARIRNNASIFNVTMQGSGFIGVFDNVKVEGAYLGAEGDSAITITDNASILQHAGNRTYLFTDGSEKMHIGGEAVVLGSTVSGNFIGEKVKIDLAHVSGDTILLGPVNIAPNCTLKGKTHVTGPFDFASGEYMDGVKVVPSNKTARVSTSSNKMTAKGAIKALTEGVINNAQSIKALESKELQGIQRYLDVINETLEEYESYTTDLIKLIKYPAMADASVIETQNLLVAIKRAKRAMNHIEEIEALKSASETLEQAFVTAENRAKAMAAEYLDDKKKGSLKKAGNLIAIACDDASTEQEKKSSVKATLSTLAGILDVSDTAIENLKMKVGILELEA